MATAQEANNLKVMYLPPQYFVEDATPEDKAAFEMYKRMLVNAHNAKQTGFMLPLIRDENGNKMFELDVLEMSSGRGNVT